MPRPVRRSSSGADAWASDVVLKVNAPNDDEIALLRPGPCSPRSISPALNPDLVERLTAAGVTALAMDAVPRDLPGPVARRAVVDGQHRGYRAVIEAAHEFGSLFTGQVTAAGKVPPAKVLVVGAGVAGLAAIGTASSLGAIVRAFDARSEVGEQVESMGARVPARSRSRTRVRRPRATPRRWARTSTARPPSSMPSRPRTSTSSSRRHSSPASPPRGCSPRRWSPR